MIEKHIARDQLKPEYLFPTKTIQSFVDHLNWCYSSLLKWMILWLTFLVLGEVLSNV